jgi:hypothetical protein
MAQEESRDANARVAGQNCPGDETSYDAPRDERVSCTDILLDAEQPEQPCQLVRGSGGYIRESSDTNRWVTTGRDRVPQIGIGAFKKRLLFESVANPVQGVDHVEGVICLSEFLAQAFDVAINRSIIDKGLIVVSGIHQGVTALDHSDARRERLKDQELGDRKCDWPVLPGAEVLFRLHAELATLQHLRGIGFVCHGLGIASEPTQHRPDPRRQEAVREGLPNEVLGAHFEAEQFVRPSRTLSARRATNSAFSLTGGGELRGYGGERRLDLRAQRVHDGDDRD